ncbi:hypothetical protein [Acetobacter senegalensis]|uniref:hypothetical protein n=1 Tax=Acetobacter senegalensis TaxID=446692 RepID=UPI001ED9E905|nr:hypothetical protein [Acetobacter senegalensis]MCG4271986.1 hypothetical protein [Acetobacter senegalensis]
MTVSFPMISSFALRKHAILAITARVVAGVGGGYASSALLAIAAASALPLSRPEAAILSTLLALICWPVMMILCFSTRTAVHAWGATVAFCLMVGALAILAGWRP